MYKIDFHCTINSVKLSLCIGCFVCFHCAINSNELSLCIGCFVCFHCTINSDELSLCFGGFVCFHCTINSNKLSFCLYVLLCPVREFEATIVAKGLQTFSPFLASADTGPCFFFYSEGQSKPSLFNNNQGFLGIYSNRIPMWLKIELKKRLIAELVYM